MKRKVALLTFCILLSAGRAHAAWNENYCDILPAGGERGLLSAVAAHNQPIEHRRACKNSIRFFNSQTVILHQSITLERRLPAAGLNRGVSLRACTSADNNGSAVCSPNSVITLDLSQMPNGGRCAILVAQGARIEINNLRIRSANPSSAICKKENNEVVQTATANEHASFSGVQFELDANTPDADQDVVPDSADNCPNDSNANQADQDGDSIGDVCDDDADGSGQGDALECAPGVLKLWDSNGNEVDRDHDGINDNCDDDVLVDTDLDGIPDSQDKCPNFSDSSLFSQIADLDADGRGDACDSDMDGDRVANRDEMAQGTHLRKWDSDGDGLGDKDDRCPRDPIRSHQNPPTCGLTVAPPAPEAFHDKEGDGVRDDVDNCPDHFNTGQVNSDTDGLGNACDDDDDNDGVLDVADNCLLVPNPSQKDADKDGAGDACEARNLDADGVDVSQQDTDDFSAQSNGAAGGGCSLTPTAKSPSSPFLVKCLLSGLLILFRWRRKRDGDAQA